MACHFTGFDLDKKRARKFPGPFIYTMDSAVTIFLRLASLVDILWATTAGCLIFLLLLLTTTCLISLLATLLFLTTAAALLLVHLGTLLVAVLTLLVRLALVPCTALFIVLICHLESLLFGVALSERNA